MNPFHRHPHALQCLSWPAPSSASTDIVPRVESAIIPVPLVKHTPFLLHSAPASSAKGIEGEGTKMGNCQASEVAMVVIQHPGGKVERLYWPTSTADVMKSNPGYCVALVSEQKQDGGGTVRFTRLRLLKPKDMLLLGQVYRLITSQEVAQAIMQRKHDKLKKNQAESIEGQQRDEEEHRGNAQGVEAPREEQQEDSENKLQTRREDRDRQTSSPQTAARGRHWRPSLQSISEAAS